MPHHITMTHYLRFRRTICLNSSLWNPMEYWGHLNGQRIWGGLEVWGGQISLGGLQTPVQTQGWEKIYFWDRSKEFLTFWFFDGFWPIFGQKSLLWPKISQKSSKNHNIKNSLDGSQKQFFPSPEPILGHNGCPGVELFPFKWFFRNRLWNFA